MTNDTPTPIASDITVIKVTTRRHKYIVTFAGEKRTVLTTRKAKALLAELDAIAELDGKWLEENFDSEDYSAAPLYAVSIFEQAHSGEDLGMLRAHLQDALLGTDDLQESRVAFLTRVRREAEEAFADFL